MFSDLPVVSTSLENDNELVIELGRPVNIACFAFSFSNGNETVTWYKRDSDSHAVQPGNI